MSHRTNHGPWIFLVLLALGVLFGCAMPFGQRTSSSPAPGGTFHAPVEEQGQIVPEKRVVMIGGPRVNHAIHAENDLECADCHEPDEETGEPGMPTLETCADCHEDPEEGEEPEEGEPVMQGVYFDADGKPLWKKAVAEYGPEVIFSHKAHAALEDCAACHTDLSSENGRPAGKLLTKAQCMDCHEQSKASNSCETCHSQITKQTRPRSHDRDWDLTHGRASNRLRLMEVQHQCSLCHTEPQDCNDCHQRTEPRSHSKQWETTHGLVVRRAGGGLPNQCSLCHQTQQFCEDCHQSEEPTSHKHLWEKRHGQIVRAAGADFPQKCSICHTRRNFCENCHLDEPPRNHTALFRTRTHGIMAATDRTSCQTCHKTDFCQRCHEDTAPRSHRGMWSRRRNTHCVTCHFPMSSNDRCVTCHRTNPTHSTAPDQPPGHTPGRNCRLCHNAVGAGGAMPLRHVDNGQNCETCHR